MTERTPFTHAVPNSSVRRDIAAAVRDGIPVEQLAAEFGISVATVRAHAREWEGTQRTIRQLDPVAVSANSNVTLFAHLNVIRRHGPHPMFTNLVSVATRR